MDIKSADNVTLTASNTNYLYALHPDSKVKCSGELTIKGKPLYGSSYSTKLKYTQAEGLHYAAYYGKGENDTDEGVTCKTDAEFTAPFDLENTNYLHVIPDRPVVPTEPAGSAGSSGADAGGAVAAAVIAAGAGWAGYELGVHLYQKYGMGIDYWPENRIELAEAIWEKADKPEPESTDAYSDIDADDTDAQKAAHWCVEQGLMKEDQDNNAFHPGRIVTKLRACCTWKDAKDKGLFDTPDTPKE